MILAIACVLLLPRLLVDRAFTAGPTSATGAGRRIVLFLLGVVGIAGNQQRVSRRAPRCGSCRRRAGRVAWSWRCGLPGGAWIYGGLRDFDPFHGGHVDYWTARLRLPCCWSLPASASSRSRCDWSQACGAGETFAHADQLHPGWVQGVVVVPMMVDGLPGRRHSLGRQHRGRRQPSHALDSFGGFFTSAWQYWPFPLSVVFVSLWLLSVCSVRELEGLEAGCSPPCSRRSSRVAVLHALLCAIMLLLHSGETADAGVLACRSCGDRPSCCSPSRSPSSC